MDKCPVCNMDIDETQGKSTFQGQSYGFCSTECKEKFDANPSQYMTEEVTKYNIKMYADKVLPNVRPLFEDKWEHEWWPKPLADRAPLSALAGASVPQPEAMKR